MERKRNFVPDIETDTAKFAKHPHLAQARSEKPWPLVAALRVGAALVGTHLQRAQPVLFSHWCLAYVEMILRDRRRIKQVRESMDECPLGAAALAGSTLALNRKKVARELGFKGVTANSIDTVSDRDYLLEKI